MTAMVSGTAERLEAVRELVCSPLVSSLLGTHPNDLGILRATQWPFGEPWWAWASNRKTCRWAQLFEYYNDPARTERSDSSDIPSELRQLVDKVCALELPRSPVAISTRRPIQLSQLGMSPKKAHEVFQSITYLSNLFDSLGIDPRGIRMVDIGAGQGYLTRALHAHLGVMHLLALDSSEVQTRGAQRREERSGIAGSITQKLIHITPNTLCESVDEWVASTVSQEEKEAGPIPVFLVALHACGSLTPDILRTFFMQRNAGSPSSHSTWTPIGAIAIGCCYNLLNPKDFPLSKRMATLPPISLNPSAYHMAAQIPTQWFRTPETRSDAALALRKVVWRAIIGARFAKTLKNKEELTLDGTGDLPVMRRLGRLNKTAYADWQTFANVAGERIGADFGADNNLDEGEQELISELEVLHVLRCILGPLVESLIVLDREQWIQEHLDEPGSQGMQVEMVNLFDQATGSGRNIALVIAPSHASN